MAVFSASWAGPCLDGYLHAHFPRIGLLGAILAVFPFPGFLLGLHRGPIGGVLPLMLGTHLVVPNDPRVVFRPGEPPPLHDVEVDPGILDCAPAWRPPDFGNGFGAPLLHRLGSRPDMNLRSPPDPGGLARILKGFIGQFLYILAHWGLGKVLLLAPAGHGFACLRSCRGTGGGRPMPLYGSFGGNVVDFQEPAGRDASGSGGRRGFPRPRGSA